MNCFYLISSEKLEQSRQYALSQGKPNQLFQYVVCLDGTKAIVQADWIDTTWLDENAIYLGRLLEDGSAEQAVYDELSKPEWRGEEE